MSLPHLLSLAFNAALMVSPAKLAVISAVLADRHGLELSGPEGWSVPDLSAMTVNADRRTRAGLAVTAEGVAVLGIAGPLVHRRLPSAESGGPTTYKSIALQFKDAVEDPSVRAILLEIDSPGGEVSGVFQLADYIYEARQSKPIWTIANEGAYSAAYALGSSASRLLLPPTAGVGSIGVIWQHMNQAKFDQELGVEFSVIQAGQRKNDFNPHFKVPPEARAWAQAEVDRIYDIFVAAVARNRGLDEKAVRATEAGLIFGEAAVEAGLADGIAGLDQALAELTDHATNRLGNGNITAPAAGPTEPKQEESEMTVEANQPAAGVPNTPAPETQANGQADIQAAKDEAVAAERKRVADIMGCDEAKERPALAAALVEQGVELATAQKLLAAAPKEVKGSPLDRAMAGIDNPDVGAGAEAEAGKVDLAARMEARVQARYGQREVK
ncbi:MAG: S49 family peptidase [Deltaproteobacteria bacterium]|nr:S49 family peptidase [Deltaproteobacteria bacterium]